MDTTFEIEVHGRTAAESQVLAAELANVIKTAARRIEVQRIKQGDETMDLGTIIGVVVSSGAAMSVARGIAAWLGKRNSAELTISKDGAVAAKGLKSDDAVRLAEVIAARR